MNYKVFLKIDSNKGLLDATLHMAEVEYFDQLYHRDLIAAYVKLEGIGVMIAEDRRQDRLDDAAFNTHQEILLGPEAAAAHGQHPDGQLYSAPGMSTSPSKLKGKAKTVDSGAEALSATSKGRKKPGPKRKLDALPPHTQEQLGVGLSTLSRDQTPTGSRPASPAPGIISAVYELDEDIPPLKKARKVDDATMMKRVRNLEETQRKVWTNIARRDVGKVSIHHLDAYFDVERVGNAGI